MAQMPAISLMATPGRRQKIVEAAVEAERRGFSGVYSPSVGDPVALCQAILLETKTILVGTGIEPIYFLTPQSLARTGAFVHEISGGRFRLGIGVSHGTVHSRYKLEVGKPLSDMRDYVAALRGMVGETGPLPQLVLATLRNKMLDLASEIAEGAIWANASRSYTAQQVLRVPEAKRKAGFFLANLIPTVIDDDVEAAAAVNRKTLMLYVQLPNYRNYWRAAGYGAEMDAIEAAISKGEIDRLPSLMSDKWLSDCSLYGSPATVRAGVEAWFAAGLVPILVPSSTKGGQLEAIKELFGLYS